MAEQKTPELKMPEIKMPDPAQMAQLFSHVAEKSQVIVKEFLNRQKDSGALDMQDKMALGKSFMEMTQKIMADPAKLAKAQMALWQNYMELWQKTLPAMFGQPMEAWCASRRATSASSTTTGRTMSCSPTSSSPTCWPPAGFRTWSPTSRASTTRPRRS
ncbi:hypothetical protein [Candidatus Competibacter phosphatis]|uniref:hypothetical protein n=1 Tax=Candidatus Competibacter phosphatis TaxID=221280 RepID=UPI0028AC7B41|nr:hypothetical protein [Candidatus Competibacter phosphatis]